MTTEPPPIKNPDWSPTPKCPACAYPLAGVRVGERCPECGTQFWDLQPSKLPTSGFAITSLVLGICSIGGCVLYGLPSLPLGVIGLIFGLLGTRQYRSGLRGGSTYGMAIAGIVCSSVGLLIGLLFVALVVIAIATNP